MAIKRNIRRRSPCNSGKSEPRLYYFAPALLGGIKPNTIRYHCDEALGDFGDALIYSR
jgi:hypothetical protein